MKTNRPALALARAAVLTVAIIALTPFVARAENLRAVDATAALPVTPKFEKVAVDGSSSYILKLTNTGSSPLKLSVTIVPSVTFHGTAKSSTLPDRVVEAGDTWAIEALHAQDKVSVSAAGFARLDLVVP